MPDIFICPRSNNRVHRSLLASRVTCFHFLQGLGQLLLQEIGPNSISNRAEELDQKVEYYSIYWQ